MSLVKIPYTAIAADTLQNIIEEFVSREGTDNGADVALRDKVAKVSMLLSKELAFVIYDEDNETVNILSLEELKSLNSSC